MNLFLLFQVAPLFTDNFDYQTIDDFIKGILINEDVRFILYDFYHQPMLCLFLSELDFYNSLNKVSFLELL